MSFVPHDSHFIQRGSLSTHQTIHDAPHLWRALSGTALFRTWRSMIVTGIWATIVTIINQVTHRNAEVPTTLVSVLGIVLGFSLSYRVNEAYKRYYDGRDQWAQITLSCRIWSIAAWINSPDSLDGQEPDPMKLHVDSAATSRGIIEKRTMTRMALAFAIAVKHYVRGETGILYDDLFDLVCFIPTLYRPYQSPTSPTSPSFIPPITPSEPFDDEMPMMTSPLKSENAPQSPRSWSLHQSRTKPTLEKRPLLRPGRDPPRDSWLGCWPIRYFLPKQKRLEVERHRALNLAIKMGQLQEGVRPEIALEISRCMYTWVHSLERRKAVSNDTKDNLLGALEKMDESLSKLEKIVSTPIPFSYTIHIWMITWLYCILLPFQLCYNRDDFGWSCIPAVMIVTFILIGFAEIGSEIENPFGYDPNDLNLDYIVNDLIKTEIDDILSQTYVSPEEYIFSADNKPYGQSEKGANELQYLDPGLLHERGYGSIPRRPKARFSIVPI